MYYQHIKSPDFGKEYTEYWENRKNQDLKADINNESRTTTSSIQKLINQNIFGSSQSSSDASNDENDGIIKTLSQAINLASDQAGQLNIVDLSSESVQETLKAYATKDEYNNIILLVNVEEAEITEAANHDSIVNYDAGFIENTVKHFLNLMESPNNPLNNKTLERTAAAYTRILIINQLLLADNDVIELGWLEREYYASSKTKWDDCRISPVFIEFSGGANDATAVEKERRDIIKLYSMMINVMDAYPSHAKKKIWHEILW
ncbi:hypothetical protein G6F37_001049 [Rhizopus arrhizus]|nr:hypothetical protein G6F38_000675 [Rhizopus arrhizus]KAG1163599.1 hypothetical protein G6F37_001049 [Rhizopus arrhizus]